MLIVWLGCEISEGCTNQWCGFGVCVRIFLEMDGMGSEIFGAREKA